MKLPTAKIQALLYGIVAGASGYIAYFVGLPPNLQTGIMGDLINLAPAGWQPALAGSAKTISTVLTIYATYKASHSGPQSPPQNPPSE